MGRNKFPTPASVDSDVVREEEILTRPQPLPCSILPQNHEPLTYGYAATRWLHAKCLKCP